MKSLPILLIAAFLTASPSWGQLSESTEDWPAWQQGSLGVLGASSLLITIAAIAGNGDDDGQASSQTEGGTTEANDSSDSNSDGSSQSDGDGSSQSDSGESSGNDRKGQAFVEELKDELLVLVNSAARALVEDRDGREQLDELANEYPVLSTYYRELMENHPEVIEAVQSGIAGASLVDRLNRVMIVHFFGEGQSLQD